MSDGKQQTILERIVARRRQDVLDAKASLSLDALRDAVLSGRYDAEFPILDFHAALAKGGPMALLGEIKRASPSLGDICPDINAPARAVEYACGGASAISVLTEPTWFKGTLADMAAIRRAVSALGTSRPAILRKDFVVDEYQVYEARAHGADSLLLIVKVLTDAELSALLALSRSLRMEPLVEITDAEEMRRALAAGSRVIGVNNRNLHDFKVDMTRTEAVASLAPEGVILAALSGISTRADVVRYATVGASAILVGEALMRARDPGRFARYLLGTSKPSDAIVKVCGVRDVPSALVAASAGADMIGLIFANSRRKVDNATAKDIVAAVASTRKAKVEAWKGPVVAACGAGGWHASCADLLLRAIHYTGPLVVGVFSDQSEEEIRAVVEATGIDIVQLHGSAEAADIAKRISRPTIRAVHVGEKDTADDVRARVASTVGHDIAVLLDTKVGTGMQGGHGVAFDWAIAKDVTARGVSGGPFPVLLAGGLTPENVCGVLSSVAVAGVDVSSGVETDGVKDPEKIRAFVGSVRAHC